MDRQDRRYQGAGNEHGRAGQPGARAATYQLIAERVRERLADLRGPAGSGDGGETDVV